MFDFHFIRPYFLLLLIPFLFWKFIKLIFLNQINTWRKAIDGNLIFDLFIHQNKKEKVYKIRLISAIWILLVIAISGPSWRETPQAMYKNMTPTTFVIDVSDSMSTEDITPNRLLRSILKLYDIMENKNSGLFSLIVYTNEPYVIVPLTDDSKVIETYLPLISPRIMPMQGSRLDRAINLANDEFQKSGIKAGHIVVFTDSTSHYEDYGNVISAAENAADNGYIVSVFGVGTKAGGSFKSKKGKLINTKLEEDLLIELINAGKGRYHTITPDDSDINYIFANIEDRIKELNPLVKADIDSIMWQDEGIYFVIPILFLFPLLFKKGYIVVILAFIVISGNHANASDYRQYFLSPEQYGEILLKEDKVIQALHYLKSNKQLYAIALIEKGDVKELSDFIKQENDFEILYNMGTLLAHMLEIDLSLQSLKKAMTINPDSYDAAFNYEVVKKIKEKQEANAGGDGSSQNNPNEGEDKENNQSEKKQDKDNSQDEDKSDDGNSQNEKAKFGDINESMEDATDLLKNKIKRIFLQKRYGIGGETIEW